MLAPPLDPCSLTPTRAATQAIAACDRTSPRVRPVVARRAEPLARVADRHQQNDLGIDPSYYDDFLDSLILCAPEVDPEFTPGTEAAWREATAAGIAYMRSKA